MLTTHAHGPIREIRLERPPANALSPELIAALRAALAAAPGEGAEAIVISGAPGMFSAGLDVPHLLGLDRAGIHGMWREFYGLLHDLAGCELPVAAAITGHAPAGGAVIGLFCDRRFMAGTPEGGKPFRIGLNEVRVGIPMPPVIYRALALLVGTYQAGRLCTEGLMLAAEEARELGMVDATFPLEGVVAGAVAWCEGVLKLPRRAMLETRRLARTGTVALFERGFAEVEHLVGVWFEPETQAGLNAMVESLKKKG